MRNYGFGGNDDDSDMISEWKPPANDFYNRAARLSCWSRSMADGESDDGG